MKVNRINILYIVYLTLHITELAKYQSICLDDCLAELVRYNLDFNLKSRLLTFAELSIAFLEIKYSPSNETYKMPT